MHLFPHGRSALFPAFLTWRAGVDKKITKMMRPLTDGGFRPNRFSKLLREMHSLQYAETSLLYEHEISRKKSGEFNQTQYAPISDFNDKKKWRGTIPTGKYLEHVRKQYHASISEHLKKEVKKRGAKSLHWDVSFKEAKHLCLYHGRPIFKGLVTALNELGEVRIQFHVYTDSHEQMKAAINAFKCTTSGLGLPEVKLFFTDNPSGDYKFYKDELPSLAEQQKKFDAMCCENDSCCIWEQD